MIPFLGAGASLCGQLRNESWEPSQDHIPSNEDLTNYLAHFYRYPEREAKQLARVSQYVAVMQGSGPLYEKLQEIFNRDYRPTDLHLFLASLPQFFREKNLNQTNFLPRRRLVMVTTNYDDLLEQAFDQAKEPYHKLVYMAATESKNEAYLGRFLHWMPNGKHTLIKGENDKDSLYTYEEAENVDPYPVIIKIHGAVDRAPQPDPYTNGEYSSYVITEDNYIDYLTQADFFNLLPMSLSAALKKNNFLFLGYGLQDWNLRVILRRIWKEQQTLNYASWAVQLETTDLDRAYWRQHNVEIVNLDLSDYIRKLKEYIDNYNV